jgi:hypothetical protein
MPGTVPQPQILVDPGILWITSIGTAEPTPEATAGKFSDTLPPAWLLSNYRRAINGGVAALVPTGTAGSEVTSLEPPVEGTETRAMLMWESTDTTLRIMGRQCFQTGEVSSDFRPGADRSLIPCEYAFEQPSTGLRPWKMWAAGTARAA